MTASADHPPRPAARVQASRRRSPRRIAVLATLVAVIAIWAVAQVWTEVVWFRHTGYEDVWRTEWTTKVVLFLIFAIIAGGITWLSLWVARQARPRGPSPTRSPLDGIREQIQPIERVGTLIIAILVGTIAGLAVASQWKTMLAWRYQVPFGATDPEFGLDYSFYVFTLPALSVITSFLLTILVMATFMAAFVHILYGAITTGGRSFIQGGVARVQLSVMGALVMIVIAVRAFLSRYELLTGLGDTFDGAGYTDINAVVPARGILAGIAVIVALMFLAVLFRPDWRVPVIGLVLMVLSWIAVGGVYPWVVERFQVTPNAQEYEEPYIQRNIDATLYAFGLEEIEYALYPAVTDALAADIRADAETTASIRLLDPNLVSAAFKQLEQNKQYYGFAETLAVDRYVIDGESRDTVIAVRELDIEGLSAENRSWVSDHLIYTHGFGIVAAWGNRTNEDGQPAFYEGGIPSEGDLGDYEPRIYFGRSLPHYSVVGAPEGTQPWELDFPDDDAPNGQVNKTFEGDGGPPIGGVFDKLMFAIRFGDQEVLFSDRVTSDSQVLYYRDPVERVNRVAPFLDFKEQEDPYPAVVDGRIVWVVEGYTASEWFPYSERYAVLNDTRTGYDYLSYLRNSVKATVDAYDGTVTLYAWDPEDPILQTWQRVFPDAVRPISEISGELMSHLRYPEGLFGIQRELVETYHVTDAASYFSGQDFWRVPEDPTDKEGKTLQPSYYLTLQMPGRTESVFSLTGTYIPGGTSDRNVLTGFVAVNSEPGNVAGQIDPDYGTIRVLELPRDVTVPGPGQVQNNFDTEPTAQETLNLLRSGNSAVISGNLLTLPVGGGLLYVQPVYVQSSNESGGTKFPLLRKVFVSFGDEVGFADTLHEALDQVFGRSLNPSDPVGPVDPTDETPEISAARVALQAALAEARQAIVDGEAALAEGDFAAYGEAQARLEQALLDAIAAESRLDQEDASGQADTEDAEAATDESANADAAEETA